MRFCPPIKRGDLGRVMEEESSPDTAILIIDGVFGESLALTLSECRLCLEAGYALYGCSSIGALRAADGWSIGMVGIGYVYELLRTGKIVDDSEVAVRYSACLTEELTFSGVRLRYMVRQLVDDGCLDYVMGRRLLQRCLYVPWYERILPLVADTFWAAGVGDQFERLAGVSFNPKVLDAVAALRLLGARPW